MKKNILMRTNLMICAVIVVGFLLTAVLSYRANYTASLQNIEQVSTLTSEGIYYQIDTTLTKPLNISLTMANDSLLREALREEANGGDDPANQERLRRYLASYKEKYGYDSVFLVSDATGRYYNFNGLDRVLEPDDPENTWYFTLRDKPDEYSFMVDNDEVVGAANAITVFVNCKIKADDGAMMGMVGVGVRVGNLQALLQGYQDQFGVSAYLIDEEGTIQVSTDHTGYEGVNLFELDGHTGAFAQEILNWREKETADSFWVEEPSGGKKLNYTVTRYLPELGWHLVVERDTSAFVEQLNRQLALTILIIALIIAAILFIITRVIRSFNRQIVSLTQSVEQERHSMFERATEQLFDKIYRLDITHNCPADQATEEYFESLGAPRGTPYDQALRIVAEKQIKEEFRQGYIDTFSPENVRRAYEEGRETLQYDFRISTGGDYYWMRITARLVNWGEDGALYMLTYRQNIDAEKRQEARMLELAQRDGMTGLLNKTAMARHVEGALRRAGAPLYAFYIFDIDRFKQANDRFGHAFGDEVIVAFTQTLRRHFREGDLLGRIGGDEFAAFVPAPSRAWAVEKAQELSGALNRPFTSDGKTWGMSASIGVAFADTRGAAFETLYKNADAALYQAKHDGRNGFAIYSERQAPPL